MGSLFAPTPEAVRTPSRQLWSQEPVWFDDLREPPAFSAADGEALVRHVAAVVLGAGAGGGTGTGLPPAVADDDRPRIAFVSVGDGEAPARVAVGGGLGVLRAVEQALAGLGRTAAAGRRRKPPRGVKVDLVDRVVAAHTSLGFDQPDGFDDGLHGLAFDRRSGIAFPPEQLTVHRFVRDGTLRLDVVEARLAADRLLADEFKRVRFVRPVRTFRFTTRGFYADGERVVRLYRGHGEFPDVAAGELLPAARLAGGYLVAALGPDGRFAYSYRAETDRVGRKYNILRHAGTVYAMLELYEATGDAALLSAAERAIGYLIGQVRVRPTEQGTLPNVVEGGEIKLGGNALAAVALAKHAAVTGTHPHAELMRGLGRAILGFQTERGEFRVHKLSYPDGKVDRFRSGYYPGEALLALLRLHDLDGEPNWLDAAAAGARWLIEERDGGLPDERLEHDHWLLYALNELHRKRPDALYLGHTRRIAGAILRGQNVDAPEFPDWHGSFYRPPRSTPAACRSEGLAAAYALARDFGHPDEAAAVLSALRRAVAFQLRTQLRPESALYLPRPRRALGGFRRGLTDFEVRIDYVQHNISALLGLHRLLAR